MAAGVAVGYVLGTRAGREKYVQLVEGLRDVRANPTLDQVQRTVRNVTGPANSRTPADGSATLVAGHPQP
ncbi:hypothetical protein GCM10022255_059030 [Dactylosporangium darangshiense]|uniref:YtxH domain-containing protein n=1 Tax=Dactylosporangium darangshiense TaxID=579108 RepID=A0ABP8DF33_9ACTN